jgi:DNA-directed RNA polymerase specialized sigma24 family protein
MTKPELYNRFSKLKNSLVKLIYRLTRGEEDAMDPVHLTLLNSLLNRDKYVNNENFKAWTSAMIKNAFINDYKRSSLLLRKPEPHL